MKDDERVFFPVPTAFQRWLDDAVDACDEAAFDTGVVHGPSLPPKRAYSRAAKIPGRKRGYIKGRVKYQSIMRRRR